VWPVPDEDDYEKADAETMKAREWDEFKRRIPGVLPTHSPEVMAIVLTIGA
jgi:hypothetical protein